MQQLLWIETVLKLAGGVVLAFMPRLAIRALGLPAADSTFWPRLLGAVLIGMAGGSFLEGGFANARGLGVGAELLINLSASLAILAMTVLGVTAPTARGRAALTALAILLFGLALFEIAHA